ncbi:MAG TPA: hypothetical protein VHB54_07435 [Mucilaginibacter sp.]|nr:hypothetical protein [Mucilaginibacter sp.]
MIYHFQHTGIMGYFRKTIERRTYSQDRYYILIKRQKEGTATLNDLTELDEIINRLPDIREKVIRENFYNDTDETGELPNDPTRSGLTQDKPAMRQSFLQKARVFWDRLFSYQVSNREIIFWL